MENENDTVENAVEEPVEIPKQRVIKITENERYMRESIGMLTMNASIFRRELLLRLLNPGKDINYECGYPDKISQQQYKDMYDREGVGTRVVHLYPEECWAMPPEVFENETSDKTEFEKIWDTVLKEKNLYHFLQRIDILSGVGHYGLLLMGISDGKELSEPVEGIDLKTGKATGKNKYELLYLKPFDESVVEIKEKEKDVSSPRYGFPVMYGIDFEGDDKSNQRKQVHWTRVLHIADNKFTSETLGTPRMKPVFNRLLDIRKIVAGSAEMFWKGGFPGYAFETQEGMADVELDTDALRDEFKEYSSGLQRYLALAGVNVKSLAPQVADPKGHLEMQIRFICITLGVPYRIFMGSEEAKLASAQDMKTWNKRVAKRQTEYVSPMVLRPFVDRLIAYGVLPEPKEYFVEWPDLNVPSEKDEAEVSKEKTEALAKYVGGNVDNLIPPKEFLMMVMKMSEEEAEAIEAASGQWAGMEEDEEVEPDTTPTGGRPSQPEED